MKKAHKTKPAKRLIFIRAAPFSPFTEALLEDIQETDLSIALHHEN